MTSDAILVSSQNYNLIDHSNNLTNSDEIEQLKKQCDADQADKIELQMQLDDFRSEKAALAVFGIGNRKTAKKLMSSDFLVREGTMESREGNSAHEQTGSYY